MVKTLNVTGVEIHQMFCLIMDIQFCVQQQHERCLAQGCCLILVYSIKADTMPFRLLMM